MFINKKIRRTKSRETIPVSYKAYTQNSFKIIILILNSLRAALSISESAQCPFKILRELFYLHNEGWICCSSCPHDEIKQLTPYFV
jgi:hypothetical protein